ncbi:MAG: hypothetical protein UY96_C0032G0003 [Parcubacteria group bacterium GW2011_GWB1_56_8]|nr:MAG: hypothetical protein UY96_C0032G0003 [Parcubacteria group bacterium GW2011_GWB1_56_8]
MTTTDEKAGKFLPYSVKVTFDDDSTTVYSVREHCFLQDGQFFLIRLDVGTWTWIRCSIITSIDFDTNWSEIVDLKKVGCLS